jgi:hypothetical protein
MAGYEDVNDAERLSQDVDEAHDAALETLFGRAGGAKEPDVLEKAFARSHHVFVDRTLKEPTILKWA